MGEMLTRRATLLRLLTAFPMVRARAGLSAQGRTKAPDAQGAAAIAPIRFKNVASSSGVNFVCENSPTPMKHLIETMAGGVAAFDYNGDGLADIFFANGASLPSLTKESPKYWNR